MGKNFGILAFDSNVRQGLKFLHNCFMKTVFASSIDKSVKRRVRTDCSKSKFSRAMFSKVFIKKT